MLTSVYIEHTSTLITNDFIVRGLKLNKEIFPAGTDSRFLRDLGIPAIGFSPMPNTPILLHDHNEYLNEDVFIRGISHFVKIISSVANTPAHS